MNRFFVEKAIEIDPREGKLPAWVREKLTALRRATQDALAEMDAIKSGGEPGPFWLESYTGNGRFYLPQNVGRLMFGDPKNEAAIMLSAGANGRPDGWLNICGQAGDRVVAAPWASNVMLIKTDVSE